MPPVRSGIAAYSAELVGRLGRRSRHRRLRRRAVGAARRLTGSRVRRDLPPTTSSGAQTSSPYDLTVYQLGQLVAPRLSVALSVPLSRPAGPARRAAPPRPRRRAAAGAPDATTTERSSQPTSRTRASMRRSWRSPGSTPPLLLLADDAPGRRRRRGSPPFTRLNLTTCARVARGARRNVHSDTDPVAEEEAARRARPRSRAARHPGDAIVFGCFGGLTPDKRLPQILDAFRDPRAYPAARSAAGGRGRRPITIWRRRHRARAQAADVVDTGYLETDEELTDHLIAACDVTLNLRWPTARELSGPWLRASPRAADRSSSTWPISPTSRLDPEPGCRHHGRRRPERRSPSPSTSWTRLTRCGWRCGGWPQDAALREQLGPRRARIGCASIRRAHARRLQTADPACGIPAGTTPRLPAHLVDDTSETEALLALLGVPVPLE